MGLKTFARTIVAAVFALASGAIVAWAGPEMCPQLQQELAALDSGGATQAEYAKLDAMVQQQRAQLDDMMATARQAGCVGGFFFKKRAPGCGAQLATIDRMQANLKRLQKQRNKFAGDPFGNDGGRSALINALAANQCSTPDGGIYAAEPPRRRGFFATLFGAGRGFGNDYGGGEESSGTFRTLCVRTCDGYYFPISFSTVPQKFAADDQACHAMCPGTDVALYTYRNPGENVQSAVSLAGEPYTALPTAFKYRETYDAACTCHSTTAQGEVPGLSTAAPADATAINPDDFVTVPDPDAAVEARPLPPPATNPPATIEAAPPPPPEPPRTASEGFGAAPKGQVRIVGPNYYVAE